MEQPNMDMSQQSQAAQPQQATSQASAPQPQQGMAQEGAMLQQTSSNDFGSFISSLNWVEVSFGIVGAAALFYTVYYYRHKLQIDKLLNNNMQKQIDDLNMKMQDEINVKQKPVPVNGNFLG